MSVVGAGAVGVVARSAYQTTNLGGQEFESLRARHKILERKLDFQQLKPAMQNKKIRMATKARSGIE